jgi:hypothetical protein
MSPLQPSASPGHHSDAPNSKHNLEGSFLDFTNEIKTDAHSGLCPHSKDDAGVISGYGIRGWRDSHGNIEFAQINSGVDVSSDA